MPELDSHQLFLGADHAGYALKEHLKAWLGQAHGTWVLHDLGTHSAESTDYPLYGHRVAQQIQQHPDSLGLLVCGTGLGISMAANRHAGVRAAVCGDAFSARMARLHNDANVLCLGARVVGTGLAETLLDAFLSVSFEGGRHGRRVALIEPE